MKEIETSYLLGLTKTDWLCLSFLTGIGPARLSRLYTYLHHLHQNDASDLSDANRLFAEAESKDLSYELLRALKWPEVTAREAMEYLSNDKLNKEQELKRDQSLEWLSQPNHFLLLQDDPLYPRALANITVAPAFLYVEGNREALTYPYLGIVGARKCTRYGHEATLHFAEQLSSRGIGIVSGGAMGIDTAAHQGALQANAAPTIAVMGTGLLHRYPMHNSKLFEQILEQHGAIVSEYPLMTTPRPHQFPPRNRIISGMSMGVLVAEASIKSGSLISASYAVQQNREVFALPGRLSDSLSEGCHQLIRQGATLVRHVEDILVECDYMEDVLRSEKKSEEINKNNVINDDLTRTSLLKTPSFTPLPDLLSDQAKTLAILIELENYPLDFDAIVRKTNMKADVLMQILMELELASCIHNREGIYARC